MNRKEILLIFKGDIFDLPPMLAIIDSLKKKYNVKVISHLYEGNIESLNAIYQEYSVSFISRFPLQKSRQIRVRLLNRIKRICFHYYICALFKKLKYDVLWVVHEDTIIKFNKMFRGKRYIVSLYELNDTLPQKLKAIKPYVQDARQVVVPEYNRANILRTWLKLSKTPNVLPNKPIGHPRRRNLKNPYSNLINGKKVILYQGLVIEERKIDAYCEAVRDMQDILLVVMGNGCGDEIYKKYLKETYPYVLFIDFINPPRHLEVTSCASIGIVTYDYSMLNTIYCAPNKIWEYTGFGIPMIANEIPGLKYPIEKYNAGICTNTEDKECIKEAIEKIMTDYDMYAKGALAMYDSVDVDNIIQDVVEKFLDE